MILIMALMALMTPLENTSAAPTERYFGVYGSICPTPRFTGEGGGSGNWKKSPPNTTQTGLIADFLAAVRDGKPLANFIDKSKLPDTTLDSCVNAIRSFGSKKQCVMGELYLLGDGEVRLDWMCNGKRDYNVFFTFEGRKISNIWAMHGVMPRVYVPRNQ